MDSNSEIQRYNMYPMLHFHRKFSSSITAQVLNSKLDKQRKDPLLYYICWAGYEGTIEEYSWLAAFDLKNASQLVADFHVCYPEKQGLSPLT